MKFKLTALFGILTVWFFFSVSTATAQKEADIVNKLRSALRDAALDIPEPPIIGKGTIIMYDISFKGTLYYHKPNSRMELVFQDATYIRFGNDTVEWEYDPFKKRHFIQKQSPSAYERGIETDKILDFGSKSLLNYKKLKYPLKFKGEEKIDSIQTYVLELTLKNEDVSLATFYIDKRTSLIYKSQLGPDIRWYANYKRIGNFVYPLFAAYSSANINSMIFKFDEVSIGKSIPDSLFIIPREAYKSQAQFNNTINRMLDSADSLLEISNDAAISKYTDILKLDGNNYRAYNGRGLAKTYNEKYYEAIADLNIALDINPEGSRAFNNRGLAKFYLGDKQGALKDYTEALRFDSTLISSYKNRGLLYLREGHYSEARDDFSKAITYRSNDSDAHYKLGVSLTQLGQYQDALLCYNKAFEFGYESDEFYNYKGVTEYKLAQYTDAAATFRKAIKKNPDNLQYVENLGNSLYRLENYSEAQAVFEQYLKKDPKKDDIHNMVGLCKYREEEFKGAIVHFTKAIELNNTVSIYAENRGDAKSELEDYEGAISDYTLAITINASDAEIFYKRGMVKIRSSKKLEGCLDLSTANDMKYEDAKEAIMKHCN